MVLFRGKVKNKNCSLSDSSCEDDSVVNMVVKVEVGGKCDGGKYYVETINNMIFSVS